MVYLIGFIGFIFGFAIGQAILSRLLKDYTKEELFELMKSRGGRFRYGSIGWVAAILGMLWCIYLYNFYTG